MRVLISDFEIALIKEIRNVLTKLKLKLALFILANNIAEIFKDLVFHNFFKK